MSFVGDKARDAFEVFLDPGSQFSCMCPMQVPPPNV